MILLAQIIILLMVLGVLSAFSAVGWVWIVSVAGLLSIYSFLITTSWWFLTPVWIVFLIFTIVFFIKPVRILVFSWPMMRYLRTVLPPMRQTEREAVQAGQTWIEAQLFRGEPNWDEILTISGSELSTKEQHFLTHEVAQLCVLADDWRLAQGDQALENQLWAFIRANGFLGMIIPKKYGGKEFSEYAHSAVIAKIASRSTSVAISVMVPNSLGPADMLLNYGTQEQKNYYLPRLASGEEIPCFALTSLEAGSDASAIEDTGVVCIAKYQGQSTLGIKLSWNKRYITLAPIATVMGLAFNLSDPDHLLAGDTNIGITLALIPTQHPGVEIGRRHAPMNLPFMNGPTTGKDVFIPLDWVIGGRANVGKGWLMMMESLASGRGLSLPAVSAGLSQLCYRMTGAYAGIRKQFNQPIGHFEGVAEPMARIAGYTYMIEAMRCFVLSGLEQGLRPAVLTAIAKYHMTEMARTVVNDAMDIHGGRAIQCGPRNYLNFAYQTLPINITVEGANLLTRNLIIFGQGAMRCHPYLHAELALLDSDDPDSKITEFDHLLCEHAKYFLRNLIQSFVSSVTLGRIHTSPTKPPNRRYYYRQLTRMSKAISLVSDMALALLGGELKKRENLSARLGDVLSFLCMGVAILKYDKDNDYANDYTPLLHWSLQTCLYQIQKAFDDALRNFPNRISALLLRVLIFPYGRRYRLPKDELGYTIAKQMLQSSNRRDALTHLCYLNNKTDDMIGRMEEAFNLLNAVEIIDKKLYRATRDGYLPNRAPLTHRLALAIKGGILTTQEVEQYKRYDEMRKEAIAVDAFANE